MTAEKEGHFEIASRHLRTALELRPNHPGLTYALAQTEASAGNMASARHHLAAYASFGLTTDLSRVEAFAPLLIDPKFASVRAQLAANGEPVGNAHVALRAVDNLLLTEGFAFDAKRKRWLLGSIYESRIAASDNTGALSTFAHAPEKLWSAMGMKLDANRNLLWVATAITPQTRGTADDSHGRAGLVAFDLDSGEVRHSWAAPDRGHWFGDLLLLDDGSVMLSDSLQPTLLLWNTNTGVAEPFVSDEDFISPQGLVVSADGQSLILADYAMGLFKIDMQTRFVSPIQPADNFSPYGIDGLYRFGENLIAVQNGTSPQRVVRIQLNKDMTAVSDYQVLAANLVGFMEPTLGEVRDGHFYFLANSGWPLFNDLPIDEEAVSANSPKPLIYAIPLR